jgi:hypothetical protein
VNPVPPNKLTLATFSTLLRTRFRIELSPTQAIELVLLEATSGGTFAKGGAKLPKYDSFSLLFYGAQSQPLQQGTYAFEHPQLGKFDLFIVPVAAEDGLLYYQAVFNQLVNPA